MNENEIRNIPKMLTISEASREANMTYNAVRQLCIQGMVKTIKVGTKWLINQESFALFLSGTER